MDVKQFFQNQLAKNQILNKKFKQSAARTASIRIIIFIVALSAFIYFVNDRELQSAMLVGLVFIIAFVLLVKRHNRIKFARDQYQYITDINVEELARMRGDLSTIENGIEFSEKEHPYTEDLDIFGNHSVFQLLNRTSTYPGKNLLAERLLGRNKVNEIPLYQKGVEELAQKPELLQEYQALGRHVKASSSDFNKFNLWLTEPPRQNQVRAFKFWLYFLPSLFLIGFGLTTLLSITYYTLLPLIIINLFILAKQHKYAMQVVENTSASLNMLKSFVHHINLLESQKFSSNFLIQLTAKFNNGQHHAKHEIGRITSLLENLQTRNNIFHVFINVPLLLDIQWLTRIESWQARNQINVTQWFDALAEFEVLLSLAGQAFAHKKWVFPTLNNEPFYLDGKEIGHPLILEGKRVANSFHMAGKGEVILLTGPNMAGKSTFLRTIGVNIILAKIGGVVCASEFKLNPDVNIFTTMRIKDDLSESISSFYAELSRIKQLLDLVDQGEPVLYFLDEVLKGTNSADRHKGAEALMKQLSKLQVSGFVSTHDLALGELAKEQTSVQNYSFESIITNGEITFDYTIKQGICKSFNACELMRQMGIDV